jgi:hypothetical protein
MSKIKMLSVYLLVAVLLSVFMVTCSRFNFLTRKQVKEVELKSTVTAFNTTYNDILSNLVTNYLNDNGVAGDIKGDWTGDGCAFAPHILFVNGYTTEAKQVMDFARNLQLTPAFIIKSANKYKLFRRNIVDNKTPPLGTTQIVDFIVGFGGYYNGPTYYPEAGDWCASIALGVTGGSAIVKTDPNPLGDINGYIAGLASVANTALVGANTCLNPNLVNYGNDLVTSLNGYWDSDRGYYFDGTPGHQGTVEFSSFQNGTALWALTWAYGIRKDADTLSKINSLYDKGEMYLWDVTRGGYADVKEGYNGKDAGANLLWCRGLLWAYWVTGDTKFLNKGKAVLEFIERDLIMIDFAVSTPENTYKIMAHDWYITRGPSSNFCTGCNYLLLECIWLYNHLVQTGPLVGNIPVTTNPGCAKTIAGN